MLQNLEQNYLDVFPFIYTLKVPILFGSNSFQLVERCQNYNKSYTLFIENSIHPWRYSFKFPKGRYKMTSIPKAHH